MTGMITEQGYREGEYVDLAPGAARTANGNGNPVAVGRNHTLRASLRVTAAAGTTPSLTVTLQTSEDGVTWRNLQAFAAATGVSTQRLAVSGLDRFVRASWAITGTTPSLTFAVGGELV